VEVLPAAPTFLTMLVLSDCASTYDMSSVKYVTYGAEVMPAGTLSRCREIFPRATMLQKYGTTEIGTMRSKSRSDESLWVKLGGEGYAWRVVDGMLQIKAHSAMLGYLNAPSPFTDDGWFITGDAVEVEGEYLRILGRKSDMINVGGQKVYPAEVENVIRDLDNVAEVTVFGERNPLMGNIIVARIQLLAPEDAAGFRVRLKKHVGAKLEPHKVPVKIEIVAKDKVSSRYKKERPRSADAPEA
jgi:acyl-CoA synthetase (AMP-forming)/AMP-acid ligase II